MTLITIENDTWQIGVLPETGASLAFGRLKRGGAWIDLLRPTAEEDYGNPSRCASFPLIPWSNRIRAAKFMFRGQDYQLAVTSPDGTAIHGVARRLPWQVADTDPQHVRLTLDTRDHEAVNFPFQFSAALEYSLSGADFSLTTTIRSQDPRDMPAGFGHHPYFVRALDLPDGGWDHAQIEAPYDRQFILRDKLAIEPSIPVMPSADYRALRTVEPEAMDEEHDFLLTGRQGERPTRLVYPEAGIDVEFHSEAIFAHAILFAPRDLPFFAFEPVTNINDGLNLYEQGLGETGVFVLGPGESKTGRMWLRALR
jgi:aldose 1-epimerase